MSRIWKENMPVPQNRIEAELTKNPKLTRAEAEEEARNSIESEIREDLKTYTSQRIYTIEARKEGDSSIYVFTNSEGIESFLSQSEYNKFLNKNKELKKALGKNGENLKNGVPFELKDLSSEANPKGDKRIAFERNQDEIDSAISRILAPPAKGKAATVPSEEAAKIKEFEKSITRARGEISEPIRIMMGEYLDSNINFFKSMSKAGSLLAKAKVESNLLEQDDGALFSKKEVKGWKKIQIRICWLGWNVCKS